jgi:hypothetical protein
MYDADTIEAINCEQLVTATDRLLIRGCRMSKRRPSIPSLGHHARGSQPSIQLAPVVAAVQPRIQPTAVVRAARASRTQVFAITVVIPTLVGIAVGLAAML